MVAGSRGKEHPWQLIAEGQARVEHVALIAVHDGGGRILHLITISHLGSRGNEYSFRPEFPVAKAVLINILIISRPVKCQLLVRRKNQTQLAASLVHLVVLV